MASTSAPSDQPSPVQKCGLTQAQFAQLQTAAQKLDQQLWDGVKDRDLGRWTQSVKKAVDFRVRGLLDEIVDICKLAPCTKEFRDERTSHLTRRIRCVMRVFKDKPEYRTGTIPNISWDDTFAPPQFYSVEGAQDELGWTQGRTDGTVEAGNVQGRRTAEELRKLREMGVIHMGGKLDKGKRKAEEMGEVTSTRQESVDSEGSARASKRRQRKKFKSVEFIVESDDDGEVVPGKGQGERSNKGLRMKTKPKYIDISSDEDRGQHIKHSDAPKPVAKATPHSKAKPRRKTKTLVTANLPLPPPCTRCTIGVSPCEPHGYGKACSSCRKARQCCSHSKLTLPTDPITNTHNPPPLPLQTNSAVPYSVQKRNQQEAAGPKSPKLPKITFKLATGSRDKRPNADAGPSTDKPVMPQLKPQELTSLAAEGEPLSDAAGRHSDVKLMLTRMEDLDRKVRELQAAEKVGVMANMMARMKEVTSEVQRVETTVSAEVKRVEGQMTSEANRFETKMASDLRGVEAAVKADVARVETMLCDEVKRVEQKWNVDIQRVEMSVDDATLQFNRRMGAIQPIPEKLAMIDAKLAELGDLIDNEPRQRQQDNQEMELRWDQDLRSMERRLEERLDDKLEEQDSKMEDRLDVKIAESLSRLQIDIEKTPWARDFEDRYRKRQQEIERSFLARPTMEQINALYTSNTVTETMIQQLEKIQLRSDEQQQSLRAGLYTVERLFLQQLAGLVDVDAAGQLSQILQRSEAAIRGRVEGGMSGREGTYKAVGQEEGDMGLGDIDMSGCGDGTRMDDRAVPEQDSAYSSVDGLAAFTIQPGQVAPFIKSEAESDDKGEGSSLRPSVESRRLVKPSRAKQRFSSLPPPSSPRKAISPRRTRSKAREVRSASGPVTLPAIIEGAADTPPANSSPLTDISLGPHGPLSQASLSDIIDMEMVGP